MSFDIFTKFATDENLEIVGAWHNLDLKGESRIRVARMDNPKHTQVTAKLYADNAEALAAEKEGDRTKPESLTRQILVEGMAEAVLLDWEGISYKGKVLKYSKENAKLVMQHKDFLELVLRVASDIENFRLKEEAEQVKN